MGKYYGYIEDVNFGAFGYDGMYGYEFNISYDDYSSIDNSMCCFIDPRGEIDETRSLMLMCLYLIMLGL